MSFIYNYFFPNTKSPVKDDNNNNKIQSIKEETKVLTLEKMKSVSDMKLYIEQKRKNWNEHSIFEEIEDIKDTFNMSEEKRNEFYERIQRESRKARSLAMKKNQASFHLDQDAQENCADLKFILDSCLMSNFFLKRPFACQVEKSKFENCVEIQRKIFVEMGYLTVFAFMTNEEREKIKDIADDSYLTQIERDQKRSIVREEQNENEV